MFYKRHESFRFVFDPPLEVSFHTKAEDSLVSDMHGYMEGQIIDISPHGMKMHCDVKLKHHLPNSTKIDIRFVIDTHTIEAHGEIKWSKVFGNLYELGVLFKDGQALETMIISELKLRRKKEVLGGKNKSVSSKNKEPQAFRNTNR